MKETADAVYRRVSKEYDLGVRWGYRSPEGMEILIGARKDAPIPEFKTKTEHLDRNFKRR